MNKFEQVKKIVEAASMANTACEALTDTLRLLCNSYDMLDAPDTHEPLVSELRRLHSEAISVRERIKCLTLVVAQDES